MLRHIVVDDVADLGDVQAARRDVGSDEHFVFALAEAFKRLLAFGLRAVGVEDGDGVIGGLERVGDAVGPVLGAAEDDDGVVVDALEELQQ